MKVLLLQPPIQDFYDTDIRLQPIGLCYLKAAVKKHLPEVEVVIKDYHQGWGRHTIALPAELEYLKDYYCWPDRSPFSTFFNYFHFGAPFDVLADDVAREKPDLVGISSLFSPYYREVLTCADRIKRRLNVPIIAGGSHVSAVPLQILGAPHIDFIIRGEGERPLVEFLKAWQNGRNLESVPNLGYKQDGRCVLNDLEENFPIEDLPVPDLTDLAGDRYLFERRPLSFVITSRSCPHRCTFCSVHQTFGTHYRRRSAARVVEEIGKRYDDGIRVFDFEDDNLTFYIDEMKQLCRMLIDAFPSRDVQFVAMNGISYLSLDKELLCLMKRAGFTHLNLSLVTSDKTVRETTKRPHTTEKYLEVVREAAALGFKIVSYQILGLPNETLDSMIQTLAFMARLPVLQGASMFYLTPNSPIARNGFPAPTEEDIFKSRLTAMAIQTEHFRRDEIYTLFITTRIINFLKGLRFQKKEITLAEALQIAGRSGSRGAIGADLLEILLSKRCLYASTRKGLKPLPKFNPDLFFQVWSRLEWICTLEGRQIWLGGFPEGETFISPGHRPG